MCSDKLTVDVGPTIQPQPKLPSAKGANDAQGGKPMVLGRGRRIATPSLGVMHAEFIPMKELS